MKSAPQIEVQINLPPRFYQYEGVSRAEEALKYCNLCASRLTYQQQSRDAFQTAVLSWTCDKCLINIGLLDKPDKASSRPQHGDQAFHAWEHEMETGFQQFLSSVRDHFIDQEKYLRHYQTQLHAREKNLMSSEESLEEKQRRFKHTEEEMVKRIKDLQLYKSSRMNEIEKRMKEFQSLENKIHRSSLDRVQMELLTNPSLDENQPLINDTTAIRDRYSPKVQITDNSTIGSQFDPPKIQIGQVDNSMGTNEFDSPKNHIALTETNTLNTEFMSPKRSPSGILKTPSKFKEIHEFSDIPPPDAESSQNQISAVLSQSARIVTSPAPQQMRANKSDISKGYSNPVTSVSTSTSVTTSRSDYALGNDSYTQPGSDVTMRSTTGNYNDTLQLNKLRRTRSVEHEDVFTPEYKNEPSQFMPLNEQSRATSTGLIEQRPEMSTNSSNTRPGSTSALDTNVKKTSMLNKSYTLDQGTARRYQETLYDQDKYKNRWTRSITLQSTATQKQGKPVKKVDMNDKSTWAIKKRKDLVGTVPKPTVANVQAISSVPIHRESARRRSRPRSASTSDSRHIEEPIVVNSMKTVHSSENRRYEQQASPGTNYERPNIHFEETITKSLHGTPNTGGNPIYTKSLDDLSASRSLTSQSNINDHRLSKTRSRAEPQIGETINKTIFNHSSTSGNPRYDKHLLDNSTIKARNSGGISTNTKDILVAEQIEEPVRASHVTYRPSSGNPSYEQTLLTSPTISIRSMSNDPGTEEPIQASQVTYRPSSGNPSYEKKLLSSAASSTRSNTSRNDIEQPLTANTVSYKHSQGNPNYEQQLLASTKSQTRSKSKNTRIEQPITAKAVVHSSVLGNPNYEKQLLSSATSPTRSKSNNVRQRERQQASPFSGPTTEEVPLTSYTTDSVGKPYYQGPIVSNTTLTSSNRQTQTPTKRETKRNSSHRDTLKLDSMQPKYDENIIRVSGTSASRIPTQVVTETVVRSFDATNTWTNSQQNISRTQPRSSQTLPVMQPVIQPAIQHMQGERRPSTLSRTERDEIEAKFAEYARDATIDNDEESDEDFDTLTRIKANMKQGPSTNLPDDDHHQIAVAQVKAIPTRSKTPVNFGVPVHVTSSEPAAISPGPNVHRLRRCSDYVKEFVHHDNKWADMG